MVGIVISGFLPFCFPAFPAALSSRSRPCPAYASKSLSFPSQAAKRGGVSRRAFFAFPWLKMPLEAENRCTAHGSRRRR